jgi:sugar lactone lactonase YvrE
VSNRRTLLDSSSFDAGVFDGLCMDAEGAVWAARWGDNRVVRVLPDGKVDLEIRIPGARCITCCVFGGTWPFLPPSG